jgi:hypothetical protein
MAKRKYSAMKRKKIEPAAMTFFVPGAVNAVSIPNTGVRTSFYLDLSQVASLMNRRFYRQGLNWAVAGIKIQSTISDGSIEVAKLPNTWVMANSYTKGFKAWQKMNEEALSETESVRPRFLDFKIYADDEHWKSGFANNLRPCAARPTALSLYEAGEWEPSKFVIPKTDGTDGIHNREVLATGANYPTGGATGLGAVSLIEGYAASRALPYQADPNAPDDAASVNGNSPANWMGALFNEGTDQVDQVLGDMITENNVAPYPFEDGPNVTVGSLFPDPYADTMYPGGANQAPGLALHDAVFYSNTAETVSRVTYIKGGNFPCGLIKFNATNNGSGSATFNLIIDMVPGDHRGYHAHSMLEM